MLKQATAISNGPTCPCMLLKVCTPWKRWTNHICQSMCQSICMFFSIQGNKGLLKQTCYLFLWKHKHVTDAFRAGTPIIFHQNKISSSLLLFVFDLIHFHVEDGRIIYFQMSSIYNHASAHDSGGKDIYTNEWNKRKKMRMDHTNFMHTSTNRKLNRSMLRQDHTPSQQYNNGSQYHNTNYTRPMYDSTLYLYIYGPSAK